MVTPLGMTANYYNFQYISCLGNGPFVEVCRKKEENYIYILTFRVKIIIRIFGR
jgi:hypothetical protein